ncbi:MAG: 3-isopropylmalate dehydrogenase [Candidatus Obscuribacterales bacterium]|nr:3-isopropylmalate dehydrogenase [Candidatus Obscuribacterales bacterium]
MNKRIAVVPGDGIGEEVMAQALRVLSLIGEQFGHQFSTEHAYAGGAAYDRYGKHLPDETLKICRENDAILFGSVGGPVSDQHLDKWKNCEANSILTLRKTFKFNANFRPVKIYPDVQEMSPLKSEIIEKGVDMVIIRELLGDCYFGEKKTFEVDGRRVASDLIIYTEDQIASVAHVAFKTAAARSKKLTSVDKANVLDTSKLWRAVVREVATQYPDVQLDEMLVDNCAMQLVRDPSQFDVLVTSNMFGDILSDAAAVLPGSLGLLASASLNSDGFGLYEPPGGSAPDIAGTGRANPIAQILSVSLLLRFSFGLENEARAIEHSVEQALKAGYRTQDIYRANQKGSGTLVDCQKMTDHILAGISANQLAALV